MSDTHALPADPDDQAICDLVGGEMLPCQFCGTPTFMFEYEGKPICAAHVRLALARSRERAEASSVSRPEPSDPTPSASVDPDATAAVGPDGG